MGILWPCCPGDPQDVCANTRHAETEHGPRHGEFETVPLIQPIDALVGDSTDQVDEDEDGTYGYVLVDGGNATDRCNAGREVWRLRLWLSQSLSLAGGEELFKVLDVGCWMRSLPHHCLHELGA